jgi:hypothetical protein
MTAGSEPMTDETETTSLLLRMIFSMRVSVASVAASELLASVSKETLMMPVSMGGIRSRPISPICRPETTSNMRPAIRKGARCRSAVSVSRT